AGERLGIAATVRGLEALLAQRFGHRAFTGHARDDVVRRPVDDGANRRDAVREQVAAKGRDERGTTADARFEHDVQPAAVCVGEQFRALLGDELLVRGDDVLARLERRSNERTGRLFAAYDFDDDVDRWVVDERVDVVGQRAGREGNGA